jgi:hypothetical protein
MGRLIRAPGFEQFLKYAMRKHRIGATGFRLNYWSGNGKLPVPTSFNQAFRAPIKRSTLPKVSPGFAAAVNHGFPAEGLLNWQNVSFARAQAA